MCEKSADSVMAGRADANRPFSADDLTGPVFGPEVKGSIFRNRNRLVTFLGPSIAALWIVSQAPAGPPWLLLIATAMVGAYGMIGYPVVPNRLLIPLGGWLLWMTVALVVLPVEFAAGLRVLAAAVLISFVMWSSSTWRTVDWYVRGLTIVGAGAAALQLFFRFSAFDLPGFSGVESSDLLGCASLLALMAVRVTRFGRTYRVVATALGIGAVITVARLDLLILVACLAMLWVLHPSNSDFVRRCGLVAGSAIIVAVITQARTDVAAPLDLSAQRVGARTAWASIPLGSGPSGFVDAALPNCGPGQAKIYLYGDRNPEATPALWKLATEAGLPGILMLLGACLIWLRSKPHGSALDAGIVAAGVSLASLPGGWFVPIGPLLVLAVSGIRPAPTGEAHKWGKRRIIWSLVAIAWCVGGAVLLVVSRARPTAQEVMAQLKAELTTGQQANISNVRDLLEHDVVGARPRFAAGWQLLGRLWEIEARSTRNLALWQNVEGAYRKAVETLPTDAIAWWELGVTSAEFGDFESAIECEKTALMLEPSMNRARFDLARFKYYHGDDPSDVCDGLLRYWSIVLPLGGESPLRGMERFLVFPDDSTVLEVADICGVDPTRDHSAPLPR